MEDYLTFLFRLNLTLWVLIGILIWHYRRKGD